MFRRWVLLILSLWLLSGAGVGYLYARLYVLELKYDRVPAECKEFFESVNKALSNTVIEARFGAYSRQEFAYLATIWNAKEWETILIPFGSSPQEFASSLVTSYPADPPPPGYHLLRAEESPDQPTFVETCDDAPPRRYQAVQDAASWAGFATSAFPLLAVLSFVVRWLFVGRWKWISSDKADSSTQSQ